MIIRTLRDIFRSVLFLPLMPVDIEELTEDVNKRRMEFVFKLRKNHVL